MKTNLNVVHDNDLIDLLKKLKLFEKIQMGQLKCKFTATVITFQNLHSIFPESGDIKLVCNSPEAIKKLSEYINEHNI